MYNSFAACRSTQNGWLERRRFNQTWPGDVEHMGGVWRTDASIVSHAADIGVGGEEVVPSAPRAYSCNNHLEAELFSVHYLYESFAYPIKQGGVDGSFPKPCILIPFHNTCN